MTAKAALPARDSDRPEPPAYFQLAEASFHAAVRASGDPVEMTCRIAGFPVRLLGAGRALLDRLAPALEHVAVETSEPALTICLWDSASTGVALPPPPLGPATTRAISARGPERLSTFVDLGTATLNLLDRERSLALYWARDAAELPYYESGAPLRVILHWWMADRHRQFVHAAAVGYPDGGVLLGGRGGAGKSTTALACLAGGLHYVSDDYCLVATAPGPRAYSLYSSGKLDPASVARLPALAEALSNRDRLGPEKGLYFLWRSEHRNRLLAQLPLRAILLPRVNGSGGSVRLEPISAAAALLALAPSSIFQLPGSGAGELRTLAELARALPCYTLHLGENLEHVVDAVRDVLREA